MTVDLRAQLHLAEFMELHFAQMTMEQAITWICDAAAQPRFRYVVTPNVDHLNRLTSNSGLMPAYQAADLCLCDSTVLNLLARFSGVSLAVIKGSDLTQELVSRMQTGQPDIQRVLLIGGTASDARWLETALPNQSVRHLDPPMGLRCDPAARAKVADFIGLSEAQLVFLAVGAPQSELIAHEVQARGKAIGVALCIGASIEFLSGEKRRAPRWLQELRLEWAFRLVSEPRRLWRRYLVDGPRIFLIWRRWSKTRAIKN